MALGRKTGGRVKGTPNKATAEAQQAAAAIVDDPQYRQQLKDRALKGELPPAIETMLWHYAHGKPPEELRVGDPDGNPIGPITFVIKGRAA